jgi:CO/xanthine dehydrogenase Mo-binding subunit
MHPSKFGVSQSVTRKEDDALIRGRGRYVADVAPAGVLHAVVLRSPHAHARFRITDIAVARGFLACISFSPRQTSPSWAASLASPLPRA